MTSGITNAGKEGIGIIATIELDYKLTALGTQTKISSLTTSMFRDHHIPFLESLPCLCSSPLSFEFLLPSFLSVVL
jgi:hypothetical protein